MIDFVVSGILRILESDDRMYLDKDGNCEEAVVFSQFFFVYADICTLKCNVSGIFYCKNT